MSAYKNWKAYSTSCSVPEPGLRADHAGAVGGVSTATADPLLWHGIFHAESQSRALPLDDPPALCWAQRHSSLGAFGSNVITSPLLLSAAVLCAGAISLGLATTACSDG